MDEIQAVKSLGALAQETRLRIFRALVAQGPLGLTPGQLTEVLGVAGTALSFHLKELSHAGLVSQERNGRHLIYRAEFSTMNDLLQFLTAHCCQGEPCEVTASVAVCTTC
ncbi:ArsR/SmtB family transcription factor [Hydrogenophaga sp. PBL-H3]|uniref:ArsR/SmtB family transcription factor n=1 Tax=Hydrogenophaga sp. PBL-H3 TaxID=434010 RepID=UPI0013200CCF|nr:metalloregulator ArsR/SmtB family transcription factor [Hydrogenophaga sp. PBL-H3]QHE76663.1 helix-turn-helix transcriptional regulator [Hydrogenophaga sp. PBL-H3]QHE81087.1 helix-turn-helix transcriptional regulator [Hydrogenophaga sp. PBL-H3]